MEDQGFSLRTSPETRPEILSMAPLEAMDFAGFLSRMLATSDQETVWSQACDFFARLGFAHVLYGYSPDSRGARLGVPEDYLIFSTLPPPVLTEMVTKNHFLQSTTFVWALTNVGIARFSWSSADCGVDPGFLPPIESQEFFARNHMLTGCSIGFPPERSRGRAVMSLIGPQGVPQADVDAVLDQTQDAVFTVAAVAHRCMCNLPLQLSGRRNLTPRQREVLEWVADGKTSADIATIMGISTPTVEKHLRLAREALGVETTAHALIKAAFLNQVFCVAPATVIAMHERAPRL